MIFFTCAHIQISVFFVFFFYLAFLIIGGHIGRNVVEIKIKMKTIIRKTLTRLLYRKVALFLMIKLLFLPNSVAYQLIVLVGRVFTNGPGDMGSIPNLVLPKTLKMVLDASLLNTQQCKVHIKGKVKQSRERSRTLPYISM